LWTTPLPARALGLSGGRIANFPSTAELWGQKPRRCLAVGHDFFEAKPAGGPPLPRSSLAALRRPRSKGLPAVFAFAQMAGFWKKLDVTRRAARGPAFPVNFLIRVCLLVAAIWPGRGCFPRGLMRGPDPWGLQPAACFLFRSFLAGPGGTGRGWRSTARGWIKGPKALNGDPRRFFLADGRGWPFAG